MSGGKDISDSFTFCIAPMMGWTDRHCRFFFRLLSKKALFYTEMVTADALIHGDRFRLLEFSPEESPIALQLGGSVPERLSIAARMGEDAGYKEINLNVGCPSDRVQSGEFGACLMARPERVASCIAAMRAAVHIPITVKCRIGIDHQDSEEFLDAFVEAIAGVGCNRIIIHARKAWLTGLSPKENREIPPLDYKRIYRLKARRDHLKIIINGGIQSLNEAKEHLAFVDGVMLGRAVYTNPWLLAEVDQEIFGDHRCELTREDVITRLIPYIEAQLGRGIWLNHMTRHLVHFFRSTPGARIWRRVLSEQGHLPGAGVGVIRSALSAQQTKSRIE